MRGHVDRQGVLFVANIDLEQRVPCDHPLRDVKRFVDQQLLEIKPMLDAAYASTGRPSVPPETLLKALLLRALYSVRSEAQLVERIRFDLLFRWFLDLRIDSDVFDASVFSCNRERLERSDVIGTFFDSIVRRAIRERRVSEHFSVDGTLIDAYGSIKQFVPKESATQADADPAHADATAPAAPGRDPFKSRNAAVDFRGQRRSNETHLCRTDPDARLARKGDGQPARLSHLVNHVIENRHGLILAVDVRSPLHNGEAAAVPVMLEQIERRHGLRAKTLGADRGYDQGDLLLSLESAGVESHVASKAGPIGHRARAAGARNGAYQRKRGPQIAARQRNRDRSATAGYVLSQRCRKKGEESFSYLKCVAGLRRSSLSGRWKTRQLTVTSASAYNIIRLCGLARRSRVG